jgi:phage gpG-like protein
VKGPEPILEVRGAGKAAADLAELGVRGSDIRRVADDVRAVYRKSNARRFASSGLGAWPALADSTLERKQRGGYPSQTLVRSGDLARSLTSTRAPDQIDERDPAALRFGTTLPYAGYHDTGTGGEKKRELVELTAAEHDEISRLVSDYIANGGKW